ncbi:MAG TPA: hypothetical protein VNK43_04940 [Gemmatimonadales bacterium]|nr:hypothetical protein [Gemmatimonadales bacterium]
MSEATLRAEQAATAAATPAGELPPQSAGWDPFQLMDRLDEEALRRELEGIPSGDLVYVVREGGQEVVGLSKSGVDECCMILVSQGQVIREEDLAYEIIGEGEEREALFKVKASRFAVSPQGQEVRLDQVIGVKRQPLYYEPASLDLDAKVPGKKYRGRTYRDLLASPEGREYLEWMAENFKEDGIRDFVRRVLEGEEVVVQRGKQLNPHWFEAGAMKAARNARFRLIPASVRQQVIARARQEGQELVIDKTAARRGSAEARSEARPPTRPETAPEASRAPARGASATAEVAQAATPSGLYAPTEKQVAFFQRLIASAVFTEDERRRALDWLATKATRESIKDQIDWLKRQIETRRAAPDHAA